MGDSVHVPVEDNPPLCVSGQQLGLREQGRECRVREKRERAAREGECVLPPAHAQVHKLARLRVVVGHSGSSPLEALPVCVCVSVWVWVGVWVGVVSGWMGMSVSVLRGRVSVFSRPPTHRCTSSREAALWLDTAVAVRWSHSLCGCVWIVWVCVFVCVCARGGANPSAFVNFPCFLCAS